MESSATLLREALTYVRTLQAQIIAIHLEDAVINSACLRSLMHDICLIKKIDISLIIVMQAPHNGHDRDGPRINTKRKFEDMLRQLQHNYHILIAECSRHCEQAMSGNWIRSRGNKIEREGGQQYRGILTSIDSTTILQQATRGAIPIVMPIGWSATGTQHILQSYHIMELLARDIKCQKALFIRLRPLTVDAQYTSAIVESDMSTLPNGAHETRSTEAQHNAPQATQVHVEQISALLQERQYDDEERRLLRSTHMLLEQNVQRVHIIGYASFRQSQSILEELFSHYGSGLMLYKDAYEHIRTMRGEDIEAILEIMQPLWEARLLRRRTAQELNVHCADYYLYEIDGIILGCISLSPAIDNIYEVGAVATHPAHRVYGIGRKLLLNVVQAARKKQAHMLFALTRGAAEWFMQNGFKLTDYKTLNPHLQILIEQRLRAAPHPLQVLIYKMGR